MSLEEKSDDLVWQEFIENQNTIIHLHRNLVRRYRRTKGENESINRKNDKRKTLFRKVERLFKEQQQLEGLTKDIMLYFFKDKINFFSKLVEDVVLTIFQLSQAQTKAQFMLAIFTYVKLRTNEPILSTDRVQKIYDIYCKIFKEFKFEADEGEEETSFSLLEVCSNLLQNYDMVKNSVMFKKLHKFLCYLLATSLFDTIGKNLNDEVYDKIKSAAWKNRSSNCIDFAHCIFETIVFICQQGYQCLISGSMSPLFHSRDKYQEYLENTNDLIIKSDYLGNPEAHGIDEHKFRSDLDAAIEKGNSILQYARTTLKNDNYTHKMISKNVAQLKYIDREYVTKQSALAERKAPMALLVDGGSSVGKSTFTKILFYHFGKVANKPIEDHYRFVRNPYDKFYSGFRTSAWCVQDDDLVLNNVSKCPNGDESVQAVIMTVNQVPHNPNQADLSEKGRTPMRPDLYLGTTNTYHLNVAEYFSVPLAVQRRFKLIIHLEPKIEYNTNGMLDQTKFPPCDDDSYLDVWDIYTYIVTPDVSGDSPKMYQRGHYTPHYQFSSIYDFLDYYTKMINVHIDQQKSVMNSIDTMKSLVYCKCFRPKMHCACGTDIKLKTHSKDIEHSGLSYENKNVPFKIIKQERLYALECCFGRKKSIEAPIRDICIHDFKKDIVVMFNHHFGKFTKAYSTFLVEAGYEVFIFHDSRYEIEPNFQTIMGLEHKEGLRDDIHYSTLSFSRDTHQHMCSVRQIVDSIKLNYGDRILTILSDSSYGYERVVAQHYRLPFNVIDKEDINSTFANALLNYYVKEAKNHSFIPTFVYITPITYDAQLLIESIHADYVEDIKPFIVVNTNDWKENFKTFLFKKSVRLFHLFNCIDYIDISDEKRKIYDKFAIGKFGDKIFSTFNYPKQFTQIVGMILAGGIFVTLIRLIIKHTLGTYKPEMAVRDIGTPIPKDNKVRTNVWYSENFKLSPHDVGNASHGCNSLSKKELYSLLSNNLVSVEIQYINDKNEAKSINAKALGLKGHMFVMNKHCVPDVACFSFIMKRSAQNDKIVDGLTTQIVRSDTYRIDNSDLCFILIKSIPPVRDITNMFPNVLIEGSSVGELVKRNTNGDIDSLPLKIIKLDKHFNFDHYNITIPMFRYASENNITTTGGDCGSALISFTGYGPNIFGIHALRESSKMVAIPILQCQINDAVDHFGNNFISGHGFEFELKELHSNSGSNFVTGEGRLYGRLNRFETFKKSSVQRSKLADHAEKYGYEQKFFAPDLKNYGPWKKGLQDLVTPIPDFINNDILTNAYSVFDAHVRKNICKEDLATLHPIPYLQAVNGVPGVLYIDKMNFNSSAGFPFNKIKRSMNQDLLFSDLTDREKEFFNLDEQPESKLPNEIIFQKVQEMEDKYRSGERCYPFFKACLKDEPISQKKLDINKVRMFCASNYPFSIICRMYYLPFIKLMQEHPYVFCAAPGMVCQSTSWSKLYRFLTKHGKNRIVNGDYACFDKTQSARLILAAFDFIINLFDVDQSTKLVMKGIAVDIAFSVNVVISDVIELNGCNPSGQFATVIINSLSNVIYMMYCYWMLNPNEECDTFFDNVSLMTYGDDNIMGVSEKCSWFNHTAISNELAKISITYTMADKEAESIPFISMDDASFLKRTFVWDKDMNTFLCPLEEKSLEKTIMVCTRSKTITMDEQSIYSLASVHAEYFFYGKNKFLEKSQILKKIAFEADLEYLYTPNLFPCYDDLVARFNRLSGEQKLESLESDINDLQHKWLLKKKKATSINKPKQFFKVRSYNTEAQQLHFFKRKNYPKDRTYALTLVNARSAEDIVTNPIDAYVIGGMSGYDERILRTEIALSQVLVDLSINPNPIKPKKFPFILNPALRTQRCDIAACRDLSLEPVLFCYPVCSDNTVIKQHIWQNDLITWIREPPTVKNNRTSQWVIQSINKQFLFKTLNNEDFSLKSQLLNKCYDDPDKVQRDMFINLIRQKWFRVFERKQALNAIKAYIMTKFGFQDFLNFSQITCEDVWGKDYYLFDLASPEAFDSYNSWHVVDELYDEEEDFFFESDEGQTPLAEEKVTTSNVVDAQISHIHSEVTGEEILHKETPQMSDLENPSIGTDLGDFLSRPQLIHTQQYGSGSPTWGVTQIRPWRLFFTQSVIENKIRNYAFFSGKLHIKVITNCSPFFYGAVQVDYRPYCSEQAVYTNQLGAFQRSQRENFLVLPQNSQGGEMIVPFFFPKKVSTFSIENLDLLGTLGLTYLMPLRSCNGAPVPIIDIQVFAWMEEITLSGTTERQVLQMNVASFVDSIPFVGGALRTAAETAKKAGKLADKLGYSSKNTQKPHDAMEICFSSSYSTSDIDRPIPKSSVMSDNDLNISPSQVNLPDVDELGVNEFVRKRGMFLIGATLGSESQGDLIASFSGNPCYTTSQLVSDILPYTQVVMPPLTYAAQLFRYWRGDIIIDMHIIKTKYMKGRIRVSYDPLQAAPVNSYNQQFGTRQNHIIDIAQTEKVSFRIPFCTDTAWKRISPWNQFSYDTSNYVPLQEGSGYISLRVDIPPTQPSGSAVVPLIFYIRGAENFEFASPMGPNQNLILGDMIPARLLGGMGIVESEEKDEEKEEQILESSESNMNEEDLLFGGSISAPIDVCSTYQGERITSFRQLFQRMTPYMSKIMSGSVVGGNLVFATLNAAIYPRAWRLKNYTSGSNWSVYVNSNPTFNFSMLPVAHTAPGWITPCFAGYKGSTNFQFAVPTRNNAADALNERIFCKRNILPVGSTFSFDVQPFTPSDTSLAAANISARLTDFYLRDDFNDPNLGGNGTSALAGHTVSSIRQVNNKTEINIPFYSRYKFHTMNTYYSDGNAGAGGLYPQPIFDDSTARGVGVGTVQFRSSSVAIAGLDSFVSTGNDFTCFYFVNTPSMTYVDVINGTTI